MVGRRINPRTEWGARSVDHSRRQIGKQPRVWAHHFATDAWHGSSGMRACQRFHMDSRGWSDIAYSFCIDDDGTIFEGRGFGVAGGHTKGDNSKSHAICFMGDYSGRDLPQPAQDAASWLLAEGHRMGYWPAPAFNGSHRDATAQGFCSTRTACAGDGVQKHLTSVNAAAGQTPPAPEPIPEIEDDDDMEEALIRACYAAVGVDVAPGALAWHLGECMKRDTRAERYDYIKTYIADKIDPNKKRLKLP